MGSSFHFQRQINSLKLRLSRYEAEDLMERRRDEEVQKREQEFKSALLKRDRTLQQVQELVTSPIFPTNSSHSNHVAELRKQFGTSVMKQEDAPKSAPVGKVCLFLASL